jgi:uridine phosphorylase
MQETMYHLGFGANELGTPPARIALLSGDPGRARLIAESYLSSPAVLSENRGLNSYLGWIGNTPILSCTSGMGAPSLSIIVNELVQLGVDTIIRIGTSGSIQPEVKVGDVVISSASLCIQGAANDIAPRDYPAAADPFLTVALAVAARTLGIRAHVGITASVDTFYEGQGRTGSANPHLMRSHQGLLDEYQHLNVLNFEMEAGTLFKMGGVYRFRAGCVCGIIAARTESESICKELKDRAVTHAIQVAIGALAGSHDTATT